jgi:hypothetical protein
MPVIRFRNCIACSVSLQVRLQRLFRTINIAVGVYGLERRRPDPCKTEKTLSNDRRVVKTNAGWTDQRTSARGYHELVLFLILKPIRLANLCCNLILGNGNSERLLDVVLSG